MTRQADQTATAGSPQEGRYDAGVKTRQQSVEEVRRDIGTYVKDGAAGTMEEHVVATRHGTVGVVIVPIEWYRRARKAMKDPTDL